MTDDNKTINYNEINGEDHYLKEFDPLLSIREDIIDEVTFSREGKPLPPLPEYETPEVDFNNTDKLNNKNNL